MSCIHEVTTTCALPGYLPVTHFCILSDEVCLHYWLKDFPYEDCNNYVEWFHDV